MKYREAIDSLPTYHCDANSESVVFSCSFSCNSNVTKAYEEEYFVRTTGNDEDGITHVITIYFCSYAIETKSVITWNNRRINDDGVVRY